MLSKSKLAIIPDLNEQRKHYIEDLYRLEIYWPNITPIILLIDTLLIICTIYIPQNLAHLILVTAALVIINHILLHRFLFQHKLQHWLTQFTIAHSIPVQYCIKCNDNVYMLSSDHCPECGYPVPKTPQSNQHKQLEQTEWHQKHTFHNKYLYTLSFVYASFIALFVLTAILRQNFNITFPSLLLTLIAAPTLIFIQQLSARYYRNLWLIQKTRLQPPKNNQDINFETPSPRPRLTFANNQLTTHPVHFPCHTVHVLVAVCLFCVMT